MLTHLLLFEEAWPFRQSVQQAHGAESWRGPGNEAPGAGAWASFAPSHEDEEGEGGLRKGGIAVETSQEESFLEGCRSAMRKGWSAVLGVRSSTGIGDLTAM